jgi:uroporphyrinogen decarboxylase
MTPKERVRAAMDHRIPDRVPVMCQFSLGHMLQQIDVSPAEFWFDADVFAWGLLELRRIYDFDGILVSLHGHDPDWRSGVVKIVREQDGETVYWKNSNKTCCIYDDLPRHFPVKETPKPNIYDLDPNTISQEIDFIPVSQGLEFHLNHDHKYDTLDIINREAGKDYSIHGEVTSPFDYLLNLFGHQEALICLIEDPDKCKAILQKYTDGIKQIALEQCIRGMEAMKLSSPYAGAGFISPNFYKEFVAPYESQIAEAVRATGVHIYTHTCGSIGDRLEMIVDTGVSGLECLDPPPLGNVELGDAKRRIGYRAFIKGNIDPVNVLLHGTKEEILADATHRVEVGMPDSGFILSTACSIAPHVPREKIQVLRDVVEKYGYYD